MENKIKIPILMYHYVGHPQNEEDVPFFISAERFKKQMRFLSNSKYSVIGLDELVAGLKGGKELPVKPIVITFDDGAETIYKNAYPILRSFNLKAAVFLTINYIEKKEIQEKSFLKYPPLSWEQIKEMQEHGISFYPHSLTHPRLTQIEPDQAYFEITESKRILEEKLGKKMDFFAYPYGDKNDGVKNMAIKAGYSGALDAWGGTNTVDTDMYGLKRIPVFERDNDVQFRLKLKFGEDKVTPRFLVRYYWVRFIKRWTSAS